MRALLIAMVLGMSVSANAETLTCSNKNLHWAEWSRGGGPPPMKGELVHWARVTLRGEVIAQREIRTGEMPKENWEIEVDRSERKEIYKEGGPIRGRFVYDQSFEILRGETRILEELLCDHRWERRP